MGTSGGQQCKTVPIPGLLILVHLLTTKSLMHKNMEEKFVISSDLGTVSNILCFPSIMCVKKRSGVCKSWSCYFIKCSRYRHTGSTDPSLI